MKISVFTILAVISYLIGGLNGAIIMSRLVYQEDIREKGSQNPGFTNFKRVYGNGWITWVVLILDIIKTALPVLLSAIICNSMFGLWQLGAAFSGLFCMLGHCFPVWYRFKGGKAFIAGFATTWFVDYRMALIATAIFFIVLFSCKIMSVSSCTAALTCPIALALLGPASMQVEAVCILSALLVIVRHYPNFIKLIHGKESKFTFPWEKNK